MRFPTLLGNAALKERLAASLDSGKLSHGYLICGPAGSGKHTLAALLAAAMQCEEPDAPCMRCTACRKVLSGNHPDVITVDEPEKKQVPVDLIRRARADLFVRPNEGQRKVFVIPRAQDLNESAQNALLKTLEEPPPYGAFLLLSEMAEKLLPTIRSRCVELHLAPLDDATLYRALAERFPTQEEAARKNAARRAGGFLGQAIALLESSEPASPQAVRFAAAYAARDPLSLLELFCSMEKWPRAQFAPVLEELRRLLADALETRMGSAAPSEDARKIAETRTAPTLLAACGAVQTALADCWANVGVANLCAGLFVQLR